MFFFERNISTIQNLKYNSDFYFDEESTVASNVLLRCDKSRKINTIKLQKILLSLHWIFYQIWMM